MKYDILFVGGPNDTEIMSFDSLPPILYAAVFDPVPVTQYILESPPSPEDFVPYKKAVYEKRVLGPNDPKWLWPYDFRRIDD